MPCPDPGRRQSLSRAPFPDRVAVVPSQFSRALLAWREQHGRTALPWQRPATAYRVWVSEVMLQQTRVSAVIPYFERFLAAFPDVCALAKASEDEVLHHWSGLGYYARARNLHRAAGLIVTQYGGRLPSDHEALMTLPGIGRSTAGAIMAMGFGKRAAILDANVKRILARCFLVDATGARGTRILWEHAERLTPDERAGDHAQAMMDLGALVCVARNPNCALCPVSKLCAAHRHAATDRYPPPTVRKARPGREKVCMVVTSRLGILLEKRPPVGIWGGLWSLPEAENLPAARRWLRARQHLVGTAVRCESLAPIRHEFTHFSLLLRPLRVCAQAPAGLVAEQRLLWYSGDRNIGIPAPIRGLLAHDGGAS